MERLSNKDAFKAIWRGFSSLVYNFTTATDKAAHAYPYAFICPIVIVAVVLSVYNVAQARADREAVMRHNYELQQQVDSLTLVLEAKTINK